MRPPRTLAIGAAMIVMVLVGCSAPAAINSADTAEPTTEAPVTSPSSAAQVECPPTPLEVTIEYALEKDSTGGILVSARSNLPDTTELMASFYADQGAYFAQDTSPLVDGAAEFGPFSDDGVALQGTYELSITAPIARNQPDQVQECIGAAGELLTGPLVSPRRRSPEPRTRHLSVLRRGDRATA